MHKAKFVSPAREDLKEVHVGIFISISHLFIQQIYVM